MKTVIHGKSRTKVEFVNRLRAKIDLPNGETWIVGFPTPFNYYAGEHFIQLLGWSFDLYWGVTGTIEGDFKMINGSLYQDDYQMMAFIVMEPKIPEERKRIGDRIIELRKKKNLDAKSFASRVGIDASNLSRIEQGHYSVGFDILSKIANALDAKVDIVELDK